MKSLFKLLLSIWSFAFLAGSCYAKPVSPEIEALLPAKIGDFPPGRIYPTNRRAGEGSCIGSLSDTQHERWRSRVSKQTGKLFLIQLVQFPKDADAYSCLTLVAQAMKRRATPAPVLIETQVGTACVSNNETLVFYKGRTFVRVTNRSSHNGETAEALELAALLSNQIDKGEGEIPVPVKHLPDWEDAQKRATYLAGFKSLQAVVPEQWS